MLETPHPISNCGMDRQRLKDARVEISSMPAVSPETVLRKASFKVSKGFNVSGSTLKPCHLETLVKAYFRMPSLVMTVL